MQPMDLVDLASDFDRIIFAHTDDDSATPLMRETISDLSLWAHDSVDEILDLPDEQWPEAVAELREALRGKLEALGLNPDTLNTSAID